MKKTIYPAALLIILLSLAPLNAEPLEEKKDAKGRVQTEELEDYFEKWLKEDVTYILTPEERSVFESLTTPEEKDQFIEQFWYRRDPDPRTSVNEFKEEHYRRIAYANENFKSGLAGWKTDRGRIYIIHGAPDEIERYPTGGNYERRFEEGGGFTNVYPFERWYYRHMEGVGSGIELEFVDKQFTNEYSLAVNPEEKDALLYVPGAGPTLYEDIGVAQKSDRPYFVSNYGNTYPLLDDYRYDQFRRYETFFDVQKPVPIKYTDLKEVVEVNVRFDDLPFEVQPDYFKLNHQKVLVPITFQFDNRDFTFQKEGNLHVAKLAIYGVIASIANRIIHQFEDEVSAAYREQEFEQGRLEASMYQKLLPLDSGMRYKLDVVVKDLNSGKMGVVRKALIPPYYKDDVLSASSLLLSGFIQSLNKVPDGNPMFVLGDVKVRPSIDRVFYTHDPLGIYLHVYNAAVDQANGGPSLRVSYKIVHNGNLLRETLDLKGQSIQYFAPNRIVLIKALSLDDLKPGQYQLHVEVEDEITNQVVTVSDNFRVEQKSQQLAKKSN